MLLLLTSREMVNAMHGERERDVARLLKASQATSAVHDRRRRDGSRLLPRLRALRLKPSLTTPPEAAR